MNFTKLTSPQKSDSVHTNAWTLGLELSTRESLPGLYLDVDIDSQPLLLTNHKKSGVSTDGLRIEIHDSHTSTPHAMIYVGERRGRTTVRIRDLESTNGLFIDDLRVSDAALRVGSTVSFGRKSFCARLHVKSLKPRRQPLPIIALDGVSPARRAAALRLDRVARSPAVFIIGAPGTGKTHAGSLFLAHKRLNNPSIIRCTNPDSFRAAFTSGSEGLLFEQVEFLNRAQQEQLLQVLRNRKLAGVVLTSRLDLGALKRIVAPEGQLFSALVHLPLVAMPTLRECGPAEIKYFARRFERGYLLPREGKRDHFLSDPPSLTADALVALDKLVWRDNLHLLRDVVETALLETGVDNRRECDSEDVHNAFLRDDLCVGSHHYQLPLDDFLAFALRTYLVRAMRRERCNTTHAAREAGRALPGFRKKLKQLGLWDPESGRFSIPDSLLDQR